MCRLCRRESVAVSTDSNTLSFISSHFAWQPTLRGLGDENLLRGLPGSHQLGKMTADESQIVVFLKQLLVLDDEFCSSHACA